MSHQNGLVPLIVTDKVCKIRDVLDRANYAEPRILQLLDVAGLPTFRQRRLALPQFLWRTRGGTSLETLVRLFLLRQPVPLDTVRRALEPMSLHDWSKAGLLALGQQEVRATVELYPFQELVLAADFPGAAGTELSEVMGVAASTRMLAQITIRRQTARTLDLGTGCGVLALLAAGHSDQVIAVDRNARSVHMTRFNAQLNKRANVTALEGNLFEPVHGQAFDLIFCNPPFVIAPGTGHLHTHSGRPSDQLCQELVRATPRFLREGGYFQLVCNWVHIADQDWHERLAAWFEGTGCDAWVLQSHTEDIATYAQRRIGETAEDSAHSASTFKTWMEYYERERIEAISFGVIILRKAARANNWICCDRLPEVVGPCGDAIVRGFAQRDFLEANREDQTLLHARLHPAADLRWEQHQQLATGGWSVSASRLRLTDGLAYVGDANPDVIELVNWCHQGQRLGDYLAEIAAKTGQDAIQLAPRFLRVVRRLVELGILLPAQM